MPLQAVLRPEPRPRLDKKEGENPRSQKNHQHSGNPERGDMPGDRPKWMQKESEKNPIPRGGPRIGRADHP